MAELGISQDDTELWPRRDKGSQHGEMLILGTVDKNEGSVLTNATK